MIDRELPERFLIVCRNLRDYQMRGHHVAPTSTICDCQVCSQRIVVSPEGVAQSLRGGYLVCNPCGMEMARRLEAAGRQVEFKENESAREQMERILRRMEVDR